MIKMRLSCCFAVVLIAVCGWGAEAENVVVEFDDTQGWGRTFEGIGGISGGGVSGLYCLIGVLLFRL